MNILAATAVAGVIATSYVFPSCTKAGELTPYVGIYIAKDFHDKTLYENDSNYNGISIGATYDLNESIFFRAEAAGTENDANPNIGLGFRSGSFRFTGGVGTGQERARYNFSGAFPTGYSTDKYTFNFIEAEYKGAFVRYQTFQTDFNFTSSYTIYDHKGRPTTFSTSQAVSEDRSIIQVGYRMSF